MTRVRVEGFTLSLDGYGAGPGQDLEHPLGIGGTELHQWLLPTRTFQRNLFGNEAGTTGVDDDFAADAPVEVQFGRGPAQTIWVRAAGDSRTFSATLRQLPTRVAIPDDVLMKK